MLSSACPYSFNRFSLSQLALDECAYYFSKHDARKATLKTCELLLLCFFLLDASLFGGLFFLSQRAASKRRRS